jgi:hypothetical protein
MVEVSRWGTGRGEEVMRRGRFRKTTMEDRILLYVCVTEASDTEVVVATA